MRTESRLSFRRAWTSVPLLLLLPLAAAARDPDLPYRRPRHSFPLIASCEGFFTLGRASELVIGSEERLDALISAGEVTTDADVLGFDQAAYARRRAHAHAEFKKARLFDQGRDLPPGLRIRVTNLDEATPLKLELLTAATDEQTDRLRSALRTAEDFREPTYLAVANAGITVLADISSTSPGAREVFVVRRSLSFLPTADNVATLERARVRFGGRVRVRGILRLEAGAANTLIIY